MREKLLLQLRGCGCAICLLLLRLFEAVACELAAPGVGVGGEELLFAVGFGEGVGVVEGVVWGWGTVSEAVGSVGVAAVGRMVVLGGGGVVEDDLVTVGCAAAWGGASVAGAASPAANAAAGWSWFGVIIVHACVEVCSLFAIGGLVSSPSVFAVVVASALVVAMVTAALAATTAICEFCSHALDWVGFGMEQVVTACFFGIASLLIASYCSSNLEVRARTWPRVS